MMDGETWLTAEISIHAPLTGSDPSPPYRPVSGNHFNPRSPYGERRRSPSKREQAAEFQSTLPLRGATIFFRIFE